MKTTQAALTIDSVGFGKEIVQVYAHNEKGEKLEFTSFRGGPIEVYVFPKAWKGIPQHVGYLSQEQGSKLAAVVLRQKPNLDGAEDTVWIMGKGLRPILVVKGLGLRHDEIRREDLLALFESRFGGAWRAHKSAVA